RAGPRRPARTSKGWPVDGVPEGLLASGSRSVRRKRTRDVQGGPLTTRHMLSRLGILFAVLLAVALGSGRGLPAAGAPVPRPAAPPAPAPPSRLDFADVPNDAGTSMKLSWKLSPDDIDGARLVSGYVLERALSPSGPWGLVDTIPPQTGERVD